MCEHLHCESVYFKELHKEQEYYIQIGDSCSVNYYPYYYYYYFFLISGMGLVHWFTS